MNNNNILWDVTVSSFVEIYRCYGVTVSVSGLTSALRKIYFFPAGYLLGIIFKYGYGRNAFLRNVGKPLLP